MSTYPPTVCGLATFTQALVAQVRARGHRAGVVSVVDEPVPGQGRREVVAQLVNGSAAARLRAAAALAAFDVVCLQHEYGIYGGEWGEEVCALLDALPMPVITVLHTVLAEPLPRQRAIIEHVCAASARVVVMSGAALGRLRNAYAVDVSGATVIPHGAHENRRGQPPLSQAPPTILTWGLLGPGKGIEWGIDALACLDDVDPPPRYVVAGRTHPKVLEREGEAYRTQLQARANVLGVGERVEFIDGFLARESLLALIRRADVVLLPYDSRDQVTSGVLVEAVASGRPIVATAFPHAVEMLGDGTGLVVPHEKPAAIAAALRRLCTEPGAAATLARRTAEVALGLAWPTVAGRYVALARRVLSERGASVA